MFGMISKKTYRKIATRLDNALVELEDMKRVKESLKEDLADREKEVVELTYRENLNEKEKLELKNAIHNLLEQVNELNVKLAKKSKRGRKPKKVEEAR